MGQVFRAIALSTGLAMLALLDRGALVAAQGKAADGTGVRRFELQIARRHIAGDLAKVVVTEGEWVELHWRGDEPVEVHLHGYDIALAIVPGSPAMMRFHARASGRFPITAHGFGAPATADGPRGRHGHSTLLYFEVHPR